MFGCKCYAYNNRKDALGKFDPRSDEAVFLGYSSHSKAYKVFNKRTLCVEESVHVLFDESNSLVKNDAQDEDFELGLAKKDFSPIHEGSKNSQERLDTGPVSKAERQDSKQTGGISAEPYLKQNNTNSPEIGSETGTETGPKTVSEPGSPNNQAEYHNVTEDRPAPRTWKHQKSHPLIKFLLI